MNFFCRPSLSLQFKIAAVIALALTNFAGSSRVTSLSLPAEFSTVISGTLATPAEQDRYTFQGSVGQRIYFDSILFTQKSINVSLEGPGSTTYPAGFPIQIGSGSGPVYLLENGTYTLTVSGVNGAAGDYSFRLLDLASATPTTIGQTISSQLNPPGYAKFHSFSGVAGQKIDLQGLSGPLGSSADYHLISPNNSAVAAAPVNQATSIVQLPESGTYVLQVDETSDPGAPVDYQIKISDASDSPVAVTGLDVVHSGSLQTGQSNTFTFTAPQGLPIFWDSLLAPNVTPATFSVTDATNNTAVLSTLFNGNAFYDQGPGYVLNSGTFTVTFTGPGDYNYRWINLAANPVVLSLGTVVRTNLNLGTSSLVYQFSGSGGERIYFDSLQTNQISANVILIAPSGQLIYSQAFGDFGPYTLTEPGTFYLVVQGISADPIPSVSFRLLDLSKAPVTDAPLDTVVNGVLTPGAQTAAYRLNAVAGKRLFFYGLSTNDSANWTLYGPDNSYRSGNAASRSFEVPFTSAGTYLLLVNSPVIDPVPFQFKIVTATNLNFPLTLGAVTSGAFSVPGEEHRYTFSGVMGQRLYYDALDADTANIVVRFYPPSNSRENPAFLLGGNDDSDVGPYTLTESGTSTLIVGGLSEAIGGYSFRLLDIAQSPAKALSFETVTNGDMPVGTQAELYRFQGTNAQRIYIEGLGTNSTVSYALYGPQNQPIGAQNATGSFEVPLVDTGTYVLALTSGQTNAANYSIRVHLASTNVQTLQFNTVISGSLASPSDECQYTFTVVAGQRFFFDGQGTNFNVSVQLNDAADTVLSLGGGTSANDSTLFTPPHAGVYRLIVHRNTDGSGDYTFRLLDLAAQPVATLGQTINGQLNPASKSDLIRFTANGGQRITITNLLAGAGDIYFNLFGPLNQSLGSGIESSFSPAIFLPESGTYGLAIYKNDPSSANSAYQIRLEDATENAVTASSFGQIRTGPVTAGATNIVTFAAPSGLHLYFDSLTNTTSATAQLLAPNGDVVFNIPSYSDSGPYVLPSAGTYTLNIYNVDPSNPADYAFRLLNLDAIAPLTAGQTVTHQTTLPYETDIYPVHAVAGQTYFYDGLGTNAVTPVELNILSPAGQLLVASGGQLFANAAYDYPPIYAPIRAEDPGTYYLVLRSAISDPADYSFTLIEQSSAPASPIGLDSPVSGTLNPANSMKVYRFNGQSGQRIFLDATGQPGSASWYLYGPNGVNLGSAEISASFEPASSTSPFGTLPFTGTYSLLLSGSGSDPIPYSFVVGTASVTTNALTFGTIVSGTLVKPGDRKEYTFTGSFGQRLYYDSLTNVTANVELQLISPSGTQVLSQNAYTDTGYVVILPEPGLYSLVLHNHYRNSADFRFRVLDTAAQPLLPLNTVITGDLGSELAATVYQLQAVPRLRYYFQSPSTNSDVSWQLVSLNNGVYGASRLNMGFEATTDLPGTYLLILNALATNSGPYSFTVIPANHAPIVTSITNPSINEEVPFSLQFPAIDPEQPNDTLRYTLGPGAPVGLTIDPKSGLLKWTPTEVQGPATVPVQVIVSDDGVPSLSTTNSITITVNEVNKPPVLAAVTSRTINELTTLTITNTATDPDLPANTVNFSLVNPPTGMSIDPVTGVLTWTPSEAQGPATNTITILVTDNSPNAVNEKHLMDPKTFTVIVREVNTAPALTAPIGTLTVNELATLTFTNIATDSDIPANPLTFALISAPPGVNLDPNTGVVTWTPTETQGPGTYPIVVKVTDSNPLAVNATQLSATNTITVIVSEVNSAPVFTGPTNVFPIDELITLTVTNTATDSDIPANILMFALVSAPAGATVDPAKGVFTWTPTEAQGPSTNTIVVKVSDNGVPSLSATQTFTIVVREVNSAPAFNGPIGPFTVNELTTLNVTNIATDSDIPANTLSYTLLSGPTGASLNPSTGVFTWTPTESQGPGTNVVIVKVSDNGIPSLSATQSFSVVVLKVNTAPLLTPIGDKSATPGVPLTFTVSATDSDIPANALRFSLNPGAPAGAAINPSNGLFTWTPASNQAGTSNSVTVKVTDNGVPPLSSSGTFNIIVSGTNTNVTTVIKLVGSLLSDGSFKISSTSTIGKTHAVQIGSDLNAWTDLYTTNATASSFDYTDTTTSGKRYRFYRVIQR